MVVDVVDVEAADDVAVAAAVAEDELPLPPTPLEPPSQLGRCGGLLGPLTRPRPPVATASPRRAAPRASVGIIQ